LLQEAQVVVNNPPLDNLTLIKAKDINPEYAEFFASCGEPQCWTVMRHMVRVTHDDLVCLVDQSLNIRVFVAKATQESTESLFDSFPTDDIAGKRGYGMHNHLWSEQFICSLHLSSIQKSIVESSNSFRVLNRGHDFLLNSIYWSDIHKAFSKPGKESSTHSQPSMTVSPCAIRPATASDIASR
jgi:hypothetical protein